MNVNAGTSDVVEFNDGKSSEAIEQSEVLKLDLRYT